MNAQESYKKFLNECISPELRKRNFSGSNGKYKLKNECAYVLIGFQKNKWNTLDITEFTINLSVISKSIWQTAIINEPWMGKTPSASAHYPLKMWSNRLSHITPANKDEWWRIDSKVNIEDLSINILSLIDNYALPVVTQEIHKVQLNL